MELVAERTGISKATLYRRWKTKAALVADSMELGMHEPFPADLGVKESLRHGLLGSYARSMSGLSHVYASVVGEMRTDSELGAQFRKRFLEPREREATDLLQRGVDEGVLRADLPIRLMHYSLAGPLFFSGTFDQPMDDAELEQLFELTWQAIAQP